MRFDDRIASHDKDCACAFGPHARWTRPDSDFSGYRLAAITIVILWYFLPPRSFTLRFRAFRCGLHLKMEQLLIAIQGQSALAEARPQWYGIGEGQSFFREGVRSSWPQI